MRFERSGRVRIPALLLGGILALAVGASDTFAASKIGGRVVDEEGKPVTGVTLRFTSLTEDTAPRTVETKKKGRFFEGALRRGRYKLDLVDSDQFITRVDFRMRRADGLTVGQGQLPGHPRDGVAGVPVSDQNEVDLLVVLAPLGSDQARKRALALALPALSKAAALYNEGKYEEVVTEVQPLLAANAELGEGHYVHGLALEKLGRYAEAEAALRAAVERIPDYESIWAALGEVSMRLAVELDSQDAEGRALEAYGRAAEFLGVAAERDPGSTILKINLAASLDRIDADDRLLPVLEQIVVADPEHMQSRLRLASLYSGLGRHERAMELLQEIPSTEKAVAVTIYNIAVRLNEDGEIDGSLMAAQRAAEIDPQLSHARRLVAQILLAKADHPAAIEAIRGFLEVAPDDPEAETYRNILNQLEQKNSD